MRSTKEISREIMDIEEIIRSAEKLSAKFPDDNLLKLNIKQSKGRKAELLWEFWESHKQKTPNRTKRNETKAA